MKPDTQTLYELTVQANDLFIQNSPSISTSVGLMDKALRNKGIPADAVTVDAIVSKNRLILVLLDNNTSMVGIGLGNISEDTINLVDQRRLAELNPNVILAMLTKYLKE